ncbi:hypothetical protein EOI86_15995 [Hwanghaeella grinnelliae]|uniref:Catalase n=1 Tax=Hwanghaeella grinnelliae TaxID=2500179 RepID=A0A3S2VPX3_9PROT|nr:putative metalloprotease CJM1_0395 family protein [Hwanghaeella grinnelliae]RVU36676.1 hypothetical protein EOI86_15995 [Hwanghaeella grinnelliae]
MSDLGVLVPILAPSGFSTRQSAATNTVENGERSTVSAVSAASSSAIEQSAASQGASAVDPLTGLALAGLTGLTAGLVSQLQDSDDRQDSPATNTSGRASAEGGGETGENGEEGANEGATVTAQAGSALSPDGLTPEQQQVVAELERTDAEIKRHEQAHAAAGGPYAGAPSYDYTRGPNGRLYAIGGDVQIDAAPIPGNPEATIQKMQIVRRAALAPANPSPQDQRVAAIAQQRITEARREQSELELEERQAAAEQRREAQQRAEGLQPGAAEGIPGSQPADAAAAPIPALILGATTVSAPVTTNGELLNVIA